MHPDAPKHKKAVPGSHAPTAPPTCTGSPAPPAAPTPAPIAPCGPETLRRTPGSVYRIGVLANP